MISARDVLDVDSFGDFRLLLTQTTSRAARSGRHRNDHARVHPAEGRVYKVHGPAWTPVPD